MNRYERKAEAAVTKNEQINSQLDAIAMERQWVISQARKGKITDENMDYQLGALKMQVMTLKRELAALGDIVEYKAWGMGSRCARESRGYALGARVTKRRSSG